MNSARYRFVLDLHMSQSQISLPALLGDTNRTLYISFSDGGNAFTLPTGCLAKLSIKRPTGTHIEEFCAISNNTTVVYTFTQNPNTCAVPGIHECDITLYDPEGSTIASPRFSMVVSERVLNSDDINLSDEDKTAIDLMLETEASRQAAEIERVNAEAARVTAEEARVSAETARQAASAEAVQRCNDAAASVVDGASAYDIAKEYGYTGTETEFGEGLALVASVTIYDGDGEDIT